MHIDFEVPVEHQGGATYQLEKQVLEQTTVYYKIPEYTLLLDSWKNSGAL